MNKVVFAGSTITADLAYRAVDRDGDLLSDQTPQQTGQIHRTPYDDPPDNPAWDYIKLHHPRLVAQGNVITLTIDFTEDVRNLSLTITDIDKNTFAECAQSVDRRGRHHTWAHASPPTTAGSPVSSAAPT